MNQCATVPPSTPARVLICSVAQAFMEQFLPAISVPTLNISRIVTSWHRCCIIKSHSTMGGRFVFRVAFSAACAVRPSVRRGACGLKPAARGSRHGWRAGGSEFQRLSVWQPDALDLNRGNRGGRAGVRTRFDAGGSWRAVHMGAGSNI